MNAIIPVDIYDTDLFKDASENVPHKVTCRTCAYRQKSGEEYWQVKRRNVCLLQPSNRAKGGYKAIKVGDKGCMNYKERRK